MKKALVANLYNPHEQTREQLIASFVVRSEEFQSLFHDIRNIDKSQPGLLYLVEGQRGMGKTTLLLRLSYEIENDPALCDWLIPIVLKEEAYYGIRRLDALWETLAQELEERDKTFSGLVQHMQEAYESSHHETACFELLTHALDAHGKQILLFIDNLGELLLNFSDQENRRFYDVLHSSPSIRLIGATPVVMNALLPEKHVFTDAFTIIRLEGLSPDDTRRVLFELGHVYHQEREIKSILKRHPGRVEALRVLTGGVIRTVVLLFEVLTEQETGDSMSDLDNILDRVTPLYQGRMKDLTPLQRDVVNAIALNWEAISPGEIAHKTRLRPDEVSMVLKELEQVFVVQPLGETDALLYQLRERFFNIWYLMRLAPGTNRSKVLWLLHFLESWYDREELRQRARHHAESLSTGRYSAKEAYYLSEAFANTGKLDLDTEAYLLSETRKLLQEVDKTLAEDLSASDKEVFEKGQDYYDRQHYDQAVVQFLSMKHKPAQVLFQLGDAFERLGYDNDAAEYLSKAAEQGHLDALVRLGLLYQSRFQAYEQAQECFQQAIERGSLHAILLSGNLHASELQAPQQAEQIYQHALKEIQARETVLTSGKFSFKALKTYLVTAIKGQNADAETVEMQDFSGTKAQYLQILQRTRADIAFQLGNLYANQLHAIPQAEHYYRMAAEAGHLSAMNNLGYLYHYQQKEPEKAIPWYQKAVAHGDRVNAAVNLAMLYHNELQEYPQAEKYYLMASEQGDIGAMNGLAWLYFQQKRNQQEALQYAWNAAEQEKNIYTAHTLACIYVWNNRPEHAANIAREFIYNEDAYAVLEEDILFYLQLLLANQQYELLFEYFDAPEINLADRFRPMVYAIFYFIGDARYNRLPSELAEPVDAIIRQVHHLAEDYA